MSRLVAMALLIGGAVVLAGCATRGSVRQVESRLEQLRTDVAELRRQQEFSALETGPVMSDVRALSGRLRELDGRLRDVGARVEALGPRVAAVEASLRETITALEALPRPTALPANTVGAVREGSAGAEQAFAAALATFRSGEHGQAVLDFLAFIGKHPKHPLAGNAQLWIGEAYFTQHDYRQALVEYRKAIDAGPGSSVAADAWLKIGQAHAMLRDRASATAAWQRVVREHPDSSAATRARTLLRK